MLSPQLTQSDDTVEASQDELSDFTLTQILTEYSNEGGIYSPTHSLTHSLTYSLTHSLTHIIYKVINHLLDYV